MCYVLSLNRERAEAVTHVMHTHKRSVGISLQRFLHYRLVHITLIHQCALVPMEMDSYLKKIKADILESQGAI